MDGGEEVRGDRRRQRGAEGLEELVDHLTRGRRLDVEPVHVGVAAVVRVVVNVHDEPGGPAGLVDEPLGTLGVRAVGQHGDVEGAADLGEAPVALDAGQEAERSRRGVRAAVRHAPAPALEGEAERQERAEHVGVRMDVPQHERSPAVLPEGGEHRLRGRRPPVLDTPAHEPDPASRSRSSAWMRAACSIEWSGRKSSSGVTRSSR